MGERLAPGSFTTFGVDLDLVRRRVAVAQPDAERLAAGERGDRLARRDQRLRRHAVGEDAGAADAVPLDDDDLGAELGRDERRLVAAGAAAEDRDPCHAAIVP